MHNPVQPPPEGAATATVPRCLLPDPLAIVDSLPHVHFSAAATFKPSQQQQQGHAMYAARTSDSTHRDIARAM